MKRTAALAFVLLIFMVSSSHSGFVTGTSLLEYCSKRKGDPGYWQADSYCIGYSAAIADAFSCKNPLYGYRWKSEPSMAAGQIRKVVEKWLNDHPEDLHYNAPSVIANALQVAFPCD